ncbi:MAG: enoyl-CoA hydratase/isomerase family protein [Pseudomonadota bacterium]
MAEPATLWRTEGQVGVLTLNRPEKFNCISSDILAGFEAALDALAASGNLRVVVIEANGAQFCTGADLLEVKEARKTPATLKRFIDRGHSVLSRLERQPRPVIGVVQGLALAGGLEIILSCDVVFAARGARIGDQHAQFGLVPGFGGTQRLPRKVGERRALDLMFSARWLSADEAEAWGLVNYVVSDDTLRADAMAYAQDLAAKSPDGLAAMKRLTQRGLDGGVDAGLRMEADAMVDILRTANVSEGLDAFEARRPPAFRD